jgi:hypothetical protein
MCHEPFMRMWVRKSRLFENAIRRCLPADSTCSTVRPAIGASLSTTASGANPVSNRMTVSPASARCNVLAAR